MSVVGPSAPAVNSALAPGSPVVVRRVVEKRSTLPPIGSQKDLRPRQLKLVRSIESTASTGSQAEYFKPEQTIIIFDWDDTLCPSSWIRENKGRLNYFKPAPDLEQFQRPLRQLQKRCELLLRLATSLGNVVIVTNAQEPWVEMSCRNFLPGLLPLLSKVPVVYARSVYNAAHRCEQQVVKGVTRSPGAQAGRGGLRSAGVGLPGMFSRDGQNLWSGTRLSQQNLQLRQQQLQQQQQQQQQQHQHQQLQEDEPQRWKEAAFEQEIASFYSRYQHQSWKNIISIGDAVFEHEAVRKVVPNRPSPQKTCRTKTLKLFDDPDINELIAQVGAITQVLNALVQFNGDMEIELGEDDVYSGCASILANLS